MDIFESEQINEERGLSKSMTLIPRMRNGEVARRLSVLGMVKDPRSLIRVYLLCGIRKLWCLDVGTPYLVKSVNDSNRSD